MKYCIVNFQDYEIVAKLMELGYYCYSVIPSECVSRPISAHSDVLYQIINNNEIIVSGCQRGNLSLLSKLGYKISLCEDLEPGYKTESLLNFIINQKYVIANPGTALKYESNKQHISVKQGYTKCSTISVTDDAYITEDEGIYKTFVSNGIDCLKIEKGNVMLSGYDYGFIGGASVKLNDAEILFFGDIENIEDKNNVINFLARYNMKAIFIENKKLHDVGSALILKDNR